LRDPIGQPITHVVNLEVAIGEIGDTALVRIGRLPRCVVLDITRAAADFHKQVAAGGGSTTYLGLASVVRSAGQKLRDFAVSEGSSRVGWVSPIVHEETRWLAENGSLELMERCVDPLLS
jgi:hypothetical protein